MNNSKATKRSLTASILSVFLCLLLLIGATFAWFTDSVTSGSNRIVAGNLDVELEYATAFNGDGTVQTWAPVDESTSLFSSLENGTDNLWEPGHTEVVYLKISNKGSLALKYNFTVEATAETAGTNVNGQTFKLSDYLVFGQKDGANTRYATREAAWAAAGNTLGLGTYTQENIVLKPNNEKYVALIVYMPTSVGNEANYQTGTAAPSIDLGVTLAATQAQYESDSFDNTYDSGAIYPAVTTVDNAVSLNDALNTPGVDNKVTVKNDITGVRGLNVTGNATLNLGENSIYYSTPIAGSDVSVTDGGSLTINAENLSGFDYSAGQLAASGSGTSLTVNGGNYGDSGAGKADVLAENGASVILNEGRFSTSGAGGSAVKAMTGSTILINGGSYSSSGANSIMIFADGGTIIIENYQSILANGSNFGVANDGEIRISKDFMPSQPTKVAAGCTVSEEGNYWVITAQ